MTWPEKHTCHSGAPHAHLAKGEWRAPHVDAKYGQSEPFRRCDYCGSMHPQDLMRLLTETPTIKVGGADWKYGWPHKFYVEGIPNLTPDVECHRGSTFKDGVETHILGKSSTTLMAKFYNAHLADNGFSDPERAQLIALLEERGGITFFFNEKGELCYRAPYVGYQR